MDIHLHQRRRVDRLRGPVVPLVFPHVEEEEVLKDEEEQKVEKEEE